MSCGSARCLLGLEPWCPLWCFDLSWTLFFHLTNGINHTTVKKTWGAICENILQCTTKIWQICSRWTSCCVFTKEYFGSFFSTPTPLCWRQEGGARIWLLTLFSVEKWGPLRSTQKWYTRNCCGAEGVSYQGKEEGPQETFLAETIRNLSGDRRAAGKFSLANKHTPEP